MESKICLYFVLLLFITKQAGSVEEQRVLSRRKRYLAFPDGASLTVAFCFTINILNIPTNIFTEVLNLGINYDLPNKTSIEALGFLQQKHVIQRRSRRDLYNKIEIIFNAMGLDGKSCVYKALCETSQNLINPGENLLEELLRLVFRFPMERLENSEPDEHRMYHWAHRMGYENEDCNRLFPDCRFSVLDYLLGYKRIKYK